MDNTSNPWNTVRLGNRSSVPRPTSTPVPTSNFYHALYGFQDALAPDNIIDTDAKENFADEATPGSARQPSWPGQQVTVLAATGDSCSTSVATNTFHLSLPRACLDFHVFPKGKVHHPLLSVSKACDAGMTVVLTQMNAGFSKMAQYICVTYAVVISGLHRALPAPC